MAELKVKDRELNGIPYTLIREDGRLEVLCSHGVGHTVGHRRGFLKGGWETVHGCDGCCEKDNYPMQEIREEK